MLRLLSALVTFAGFIQLGGTLAGAEPIIPSTTQSTSCSLGDGWDKLSGRLLIGVSTPEDRSTFQLAVLDLDQRRIAPSHISILSASPTALFSPDGTQVFYSGRVSDSATGVRHSFVADWDGSNRKEIPELNDYEAAGWLQRTSPALPTSLIAFRASDGAIASLEVGLLANGPLRPLASLGSKALQVRVSPQGESLYYVTDRSWPGLDVCMRSLSTGHDTCILSGTPDYSQPRATMVGTKELVLFTTGDPRTTTIGVLDLATGQKRTWLAGESRFSQGVWGSNGEWIAALEQHSEGWRVVIANDADKPPQVIFSCPKASIERLALFDWSPRKTLEVEAIRANRSSSAFRARQPPDTTAVASEAR